MITITQPDILQKKILELKKDGRKIGIVPTMGFLHEGHLSLVRESKEKTDITVVTIFVNPTQFGENEDFGKYPRDLKRDKSILEEIETDILFSPKKEDIYSKDYRTYIEVEELGNIMCGEFRPVHFRGVCTIVNKLFNITQPDSAFFGKKDYQQYIILKKMVSDLNMPIEVIGCPIVREPDGLAMSSRNKYLNASERKSASLIYKSLKESKDAIKNGEKDLEAIRSKQKKILIKDENIKKVDYYDFRDPEDLKIQSSMEERDSIICATAAWVGETRLIDNIEIVL